MHGVRNGMNNAVLMATYDRPAIFDTTDVDSAFFVDLGGT